ncbi:hypothetical protein PSN13_03842 [Micromonospora saelicesensis]|uniref:Uncharacterized protein n=1 Tax=Micromonospora saelicesensis TaxID=285676 RepID=A0A328NQ92_9ACTN|nr:hypothetical protein PSN13_03842 [Micromonospora saelicesensis]
MIVLDPGWGGLGAWGWACFLDRARSCEARGSVRRAAPWPGHSRPTLRPARRTDPRHARPGPCPRLVPPQTGPRRDNRADGHDPLGFNEVGASPASGHRDFQEPESITPPWAPCPDRRASRVGGLSDLSPVSGGRGHPGGGIGGRAGSLYLADHRNSPGHAAPAPPGTPARPPRLHPPNRRAPHDGRARQPPGTPGGPPRLHPPHGRAPQRPTGRRNDPPPAPVTPCPDADPLFAGHRAEPLELPPHALIPR